MDAAKLNMKTTLKYRLQWHRKKGRTHKVVTIRLK